MNYYNENNPRAAQWLRVLIDEGKLPKGEVDERSIKDVRQPDVSGFTQCHFFAGIGGWSLALQFADWPADREVWTGSCPCQPFSSAGKGRGTDDERHLWPEFFRLIRECEPSTVFGEQVSSPLGREWLAGVFSDLEIVGYAVAGADLCAAGVSAPHIRQRLYWLANANSVELRGQSPKHREPLDTNNRGMGDANGARLEGLGGHESDGHQSRWLDANKIRHSAATCRGTHWDNSELILCADGKARRIEPALEPLAHGFPARVAVLKGFGNAIVPQVAAQFVAAFREAKHE